MLCELRVENLALIESLHLSFKEQAGLVVMTGETGAGKSIMLRAIKLLTGSRASSDWIRTGADSCTVEALFEINNNHESLIEKLDEGGFLDGSTVIIKRIINSAGRSRLYVNGALAPAKVVAELTSDMLNMASQHDHQQLLQPSTHIDLIDTLGELWAERSSFSSLFGLWQKKKHDLDELRKTEQDKEQRRDFLTFQLDEIRNADPEVGEDEHLSIERKKLKSADALVSLSQESLQLISGTVIDDLVQVRKNMEQLVGLDDSATSLAEDLTEFSYQAEDLSQRIREYRDSLEINPFRLDQVNERLDLLSQLKRKYGLQIVDVLQFATDAENELNLIDTVEQQIKDLETEVTSIENELLLKAKELSEKREMTASVLEKSMSDEMASLAFKQSGFTVQWKESEQSIEQLKAIGWDRPEFFFSANPGEEARPLAKVASGGELSRLMLAMKCVLAKKDLVETVIFDEVDAGIGGEAAEAVARKIQKLATHHQVFCITHLPQIAARGSEHFLVEKGVDGGRTQTSIKKLEEQKRINELARMLAGESASEQTHVWAEELLRKGRMQ